MNGGWRGRLFSTDSGNWRAVVILYSLRVGWCVRACCVACVYVECYAAGYVRWQGGKGREREKKKREEKRGRRRGGGRKVEKNKNKIKHDRPCMDELCSVSRAPGWRRLNWKPRDRNETEPG